MVEVRLMQRTDRTMYYHVLVGRELNPHHKFTGIVEHDGRATEAEHIATMAAMVAEEIAEKYPDAPDPSECARVAKEAHREILLDNPHVRMGDELPREYDRGITAGVARH